MSRPVAVTPAKLAWIAAAILTLVATTALPARAQMTREELRRALRNGVRVQKAEPKERKPPAPVVPADPAPRIDLTSDAVARAIRDGAHFVKKEQREDGSWADADAEAHSGTTSLAIL